MIIMFELDCLTFALSLYYSLNCFINQPIWLLLSFAVLCFHLHRKYVLRVVIQEVKCWNHLIKHANIKCWWIRLLCCRLHLSRVRVCAHWTLLNCWCSKTIPYNKSVIFMVLILFECVCVPVTAQTKTKDYGDKFGCNESSLMLF